MKVILIQSSKKYNMKKIIFVVVAILIIALFTGCGYLQNDISNTSEKQTKNSEDVSSLSTNFSGEAIIWDQSPSIFYSLDDFRLFIATNSHDLSDYSTNTPPFNLPHYDISNEAVVFIDDIFPNNPDFISELKEIWVFDDRHYAYYFNTGISVSIFTNTDEDKLFVSKMVSACKNQETAYKYTTLAEAQKTKNENLSDNREILHIVSNTCLSYSPKYNSDGSFAFYKLRIFTKSYTISINTDPVQLGGDATFETIVSNPVNVPVSALFVDGISREVAVKDILRFIE